MLFQPDPVVSQGSQVIRKAPLSLIQRLPRYRSQGRSGELGDGILGLRGAALDVPWYPTGFQLSTSHASPRAAAVIAHIRWCLPGDSWNTYAVSFWSRSGQTPGAYCRVAFERLHIKLKRTSSPTPITPSSYVGIASSFTPRVSRVLSKT